MLIPSWRARVNFLKKQSKVDAPILDFASIPDGVQGTGIC